jgi:hypothetical protein
MLTEEDLLVMAKAANEFGTTTEKVIEGMLFFGEILREPHIDIGDSGEGE